MKFWIKILLLIGVLLVPVQGNATNRFDNYARADNVNNIGSPDDGLGAYTLSGVWGVISQTAYTNTASSQAVALLDSSTTDATIQATISGTFSNAGLVGRANATNNYYLLKITPTTFEIYKALSGTFTQIALTSGLTVSAGDVIKFVVNGTALEGFQNGTSRVSTTNGEITTGTMHGIRFSSDSSGRWDTLTITGVSSGSAQRNLMLLGVGQ